jgi:hypothetical protein
MAKHPKRPRDPNQLAKLIVDIATGEASIIGAERQHRNSVVAELPQFRRWLLASTAPE